MVLNGSRRAALSVLRRADAWANRLYGSSLNPLYHTGTVAVGALVVLLATGLYLLIFYRVGDPWNSVAGLTGQAWSGRWIRTLHRYASDLMLVAVGIHAFRMFAQGRTWGARALAWLSGLVLLGVLLVSGWTGYVMVWDSQALVLALEGARFMDVLPIFSEPVARAFSGEDPLPGAFFFLNLFLHIALPIGVALLLWVHVSRVARPVLLPPRAVSWALLGLGIAASVLWPLGAGEPADPARLPSDVSLDLFYAFWLPLTRALPAWSVWAMGTAVVGLMVMIPWWSRPREAVRPAPSWVDEQLCTGCTQCMLDCPYEAITMVRREDPSEVRSELVARVDPALCVSCGICAGSCAPMGVGPPDRTGRDQVARVRKFLDDRQPGARDVVVVGCGRSAAGDGLTDAPFFPISCAGNLHTSVIELMVRSGVGGVLVVSCPIRDCWNREGVRWLEQRVHHDREAELKERVDRNRVRLVEASAAERLRAFAHLESFRGAIAALAEVEAEEAPTPDTECEPALSPDEALTWRSP